MATAERRPGGAAREWRWQALNISTETAALALKQILVNDDANRLELRPPSEYNNFIFIIVIINLRGAPDT